MINWLMEERLLASSQSCDICQEAMSLVKFTDLLMDVNGSVRKQVNGKLHIV